MSPTWVPTSNSIPPSTPRPSVRCTKSSSIFVGYSSARESMKASISSGVCNSGESMRGGWIRRDNKFMPLLEQPVNFFHQQVVFDHVLCFFPKRDNVEVQRCHGQCAVQ